MNKWFYFNGSVLILAFWKFITNPLFPAVQLHVLFGFIGLVLFMFNWTRHAVFSTIRLSPDRAKKIKFANLSKRVRIIHRWTGSIALLVLMTHMALVVNKMDFHLWGLKAWSGLIAFLVILGLVVTGWLRLFWPSGPKRYIHLILGFCMFYLIIIHLIL